MRHRSAWSYILLFFGISIVCQSLAHDSLATYRIRHLSVADGLSQGSVYSILKDSRGFMWMTSYEGLNRFDGNAVKVYSDHPAQRHSLSGNYTIGLVEDPYGAIWIGSDNCLNQLHYRADTFHHVWAQDATGDRIKSLHYPIHADSNYIYYINDAEGVMRYHLQDGYKEVMDPAVTFTSLDLLINPTFCDRHKNIWVRLPIGLAMLPADGGKTQYYFSTHPENIFGEATFIYALRDSPHGDFLTLASGDGVWEFSVDKKFVKPIFSNSIVGEHIFDFEWRDENHMWLGTNYSGLYLVNTNTKEIIDHFHKDRQDKQKLGNNNNATNMYTDPDGLLWVSADPDGVCILTPDSKPFKQYSSLIIDNRLINPGGVRCFYEKKNGDILIGTQEEGILVFDPQLGAFKGRFAAQSLAVNHARQILVDSRSTVWFATQEGLFYGTEGSASLEQVEFDTTGLNIHNVNNVWHLLELPSGDFLATTDGGLFLIRCCDYSTIAIDIGKQTSTGSLYIDPFGQVFAVLFNDGFIVFDLDEIDRVKDGKKINFTSVMTGQVHVKHVHYSHRTESYWVSTTNGLFELTIDQDGNYEQKSYYGLAEGLLSANVYGCIEDGNGELWISTNKGIYRIQPVERKVEHFGPEDGVQGLEFNTNAFLASSTGDIFFGGVAGFNQFDPLQIMRNNRPPPKPIITAVHVNDNDQNDLPRIENGAPYAHHENTIEFQFYSPDYYSMGNNTFEYALRGYDDAPLLIKGEQRIKYKNLPPNEYTLTLRAANEDLVWNTEPTILHFTIQPPWWKTNLFRFLLLISIAALAYALIQLYVRRIKRREQTTRRLAQLQLRSLQSQMNPHFVFNCMNTIDGYIATNSRRKASDFITSFSRLIRKSLQLSRSPLISLQDEVEFIKDYIALEKERLSMPFKSNYIIQYPEELQTRKIPPMSIQPIVENAIKHGIQPLLENGELTIADGMEDGNYFISVTDNGKGFSLSNQGSRDKKSLGLTIVRERFELISRSVQRPYRMENRSHEIDKGTKICIFIPESINTSLR